MVKLIPHNTKHNTTITSLNLFKYILLLVKCTLVTLVPTVNVQKNYLSQLVGQIEPVLSPTGLLTLS